MSLEYQDRLNDIQANTIHTVIVYRIKRDFDVCLFYQNNS